MVMNGTPRSYDSVSGHLDVYSTDYQHAIGWGDIPGRESFRAHGHNQDVDATDEVISDTADTAIVYPYPAAATLLKISSDDTDDDGNPAGDGAQTVYMWGLDNNKNEISETKTLDGTTVVTSALAYFRLFGVRVVDSGSSGTNEGTISIKDSTETDLLGIILPGKGRTRMALWTCPAGKEALLCQIWTTVTGNKNTELHLFIRRDGESWVEELHFTLIDAPNNIVFTTGFYVDEKTDVELRSHSSGTNAVIDAGFCGNFRSKVT